MKIKVPSILMADDDAEDRLLAKEAMAKCHMDQDLHFVKNGEELMDYLNHRGDYIDAKLFPFPNLILLDLNMPKMDGRTALNCIKGDPNLRSIPVVILTTSTAAEDMAKSYDLGANSYISKPSDFGGLVATMKVLAQYWFGIVELQPEPGNRKTC